MIMFLILFHQPRLVMIDSATLGTLPIREVHAGMAEVIKYGVIGDPVLFEALEAHGPLDSLEAIGSTLMQQILRRSAAARRHRQRGRSAVIPCSIAPATLGHRRGKS